ncbi:MAG: hypothetical protein ABI467_30245 [Kofleriaceae bacterium]
MRAAIFLALASCTPVDSGAVTTAKLHADLQVLATGTGGSQVFAWLFSHRDGDPPLNLETIRLVDDDTLTATSNGSSVAMQEVDLGVEYRYDAAFAAAEADLRFDIALARTTEPSAPASSVTLPAPFTPTGPATASRSAPLTLTWSGGSSDPVSIHVTGCASADLGPIADTGAATFAAGTVVADPVGATCDLAFEISRRRTGTIDPAFGQGGSIVAIQQRTLTITSTP